MPGSLRLPSSRTSTLPPTGVEYSPGALPARAAESEVSTQRPGVLARIMTVRVSTGRWWPSAISIAVRRSSASWDHRWLGWRGSWACVPLPRWVLRVAPASTALRTCSGAGVQWPSEMRTPRAVAAAMYSAAPARSGARVTIRTRPSAARTGRGPFGGEGDDPDQAVRGPLPALEFGDVRVAQAARVMGPAGPVVGRERRAFDMDPGDRVGQQRITATGRGDHRQHMGARKSTR